MSCWFRSFIKYIIMLQHEDNNRKMISNCNDNKKETFISFGSLNDDSINEIDDDDDIEIINKTNDDGYNDNGNGVKSSNEEKFFYNGTLNNSSLSISELSNDDIEVIHNNNNNDNEVHVMLDENVTSEKDLEVQAEELIQNEINDEQFLKQMVIQSNIYYQKKLQSNESIIYKLFMTIVYIQIKKKISDIKKNILLTISYCVFKGKCFRKGRACLQIYTCYINIKQFYLTKIYFQHWKTSHIKTQLQSTTIPAVPQCIPIPPMIPNPPTLVISNSIPIPIPPPPLITPLNSGIPPLPGNIPSFPVNAVNVSNNNPHNVFTNPPTKQMNVHRFQWNPIDKKKTQKCFWLTNIPEIKESIFNIKYDLLLSMFTQSKDNNNNSNINNTKQNNSNQKQKLIPTTIKILDDKRIMQLSISFTKLPHTFTELKQSLLTYNKSNTLSLEILSTLLQLFPKQEEITLLQNYRKDNINTFNISLLGKPETFYYMLLDIPHSKQILHFLYFEQMTLIEHDDIINKLKIIQNTANEIESSLLFKIILFIILRIGNFLNYGYIKGNAYGFKINSLNTIDGVKTFTKDKRNLLDFLIINIKHMNNNDSTYKELNTFYEDFPSLKNAIEIDLNDIDRRISVIDKGINDIENEIAKTIESENEYKIFLNEMIIKIKNVFANINQHKQSMQKDIDKLIEVFGEDKDKFKFAEFVKNVYDFCEKFKNAVIKHNQEENRKCKQIRNQKCCRRNSSNKNNFQSDYNKIRETVTKKTNENYIINNNNKVNFIINSNYFDLDAKYNDNTNHAKPVRVTQYKGKQFIEQTIKNELTTTTIISNSNANNQNDLSFSLIINDVLEHNTNQNKGFAVERLIK